MEVDDSETAEETEAEAAQPLEIGSVVPDFHGKPMKEVIRLAREARLNIDPVGSGLAKSQKPRAGARLKPGERIRVTFAR